jgi:hypothetical protein
LKHLTDKRLKTFEGGFSNAIGNRKRVAAFLTKKELRKTIKRLYRFAGFGKLQTLQVYHLL